MTNPVKLFIVEGEDRDYRFVNYMSKCFFDRGKFEARVINLPASQNIYMLYSLLVEDEFETDIVEVLRDTVDVAKDILSGINRQDIDEVYLFFDYDIHQDNISKESVGKAPEEIIKNMLQVFDNETEQGKLYISYPMVEALYDFKEGECEAFSGCFHDVKNLAAYKELSGKENAKASIHFNYEDWKQVINIFALRIACLFNESISFEKYRSDISPISIYLKQLEFKEKDNTVFVLSGFPEFLLDYFKVDFWNANVKVKKKNITCRWK